MRIGEIARRTGASAKAIRLYEARGLLGAVARAGSYRQYGDADVARVQIIRQALALGFRLAELNGLNAMHTAQGWQRMAALVARRRAAVARERQRLQALDRQLAALEAELHTCDALAAPALPLGCDVQGHLEIVPQGLPGRVTIRP